MCKNGSASIGWENPLHLIIKENPNEWIYRKLNEVKDNYLLFLTTFEYNILGKGQFSKTDLARAY